MAVIRLSLVIALVFLIKFGHGAPLENGNESSKSSDAKTDSIKADSTSNKKDSDSVDATVATVARDSDKSTDKTDSVKTGGGDSSIDGGSNNECVLVPRDEETGLESGESKCASTVDDGSNGSCKKDQKYETVFTSVDNDEFILVAKISTIRNIVVQKYHKNDGSSNGDQCFVLPDVQPPSFDNFDQQYNLAVGCDCLTKELSDIAIPEFTAYPEYPSSPDYSESCECPNRPLLDVPQPPNCPCVDRSTHPQHPDALPDSSNTDLNAEQNGVE